MNYWECGVLIVFIRNALLKAFMQHSFAIPTWHCPVLETDVNAQPEAHSSWASSLLEKSMLQEYTKLSRITSPKQPSTLHAFYSYDEPQHRYVGNADVAQDPWSIHIIQSLCCGHTFFSIYIKASNVSQLYMPYPYYFLIPTAFRHCMNPDETITPCQNWWAYFATIKAFLLSWPRDFFPLNSSVNRFPVLPLLFLSSALETKGNSQLWFFRWAHLSLIDEPASKSLSGCSLIPIYLYTK